MNPSDPLNPFNPCSCFSWIINIENARRQLMDQARDAACYPSCSILRLDRYSRPSSHRSSVSELRSASILLCSVANDQPYHSAWQHDLEVIAMLKLGDDER